ncbi:MAG: DUF3000 domain-containing protein [Actinomycetota bacterium]|nr:DUF3000 domain-containing protein [Actinomycetota bacterium]
MILPLAQPAPAGLSAALAGLSEVLEHPERSSVRDHVVLRPVPPPRSLAPWSYAVAADVDRGEECLASGRFVVLHDPAGQPGWDGDTRVVTFVEADVDAEMAADEALAEVAWSWLLEALEQRGAAYAAAGGTVTRTVSARFGELAETADASSVEVRASWTARPAPDGLRLAPHLLAWCDLLASTAGLPPPGVAALQPR